MKIINNNLIISNSTTNRHKDTNGFLYTDNNYLLSNGIMEYLGSELIEGSENGKIDGVAIEAAKLYKLNISKEELEKCKDLWKLKPITNDHHWVGIDGANAKGRQEGSVGEEIKLINENDKIWLVANLCFTNLDTIQQIENDEKTELSTSYENDLKASKNSDYDFEVVDIKPNHLALVDKGRAGAKVKVANTNNIINNNNENKMTNIYTVNGKDVSPEEMMKTLKEETEFHKENPIDKASEKDETKNKSKNEDDDKDDDATKNKACNEDKRKLIDEIGGMLKGKVDEEIWKTIIKKVEEASYNASEKSTEDNKASNEDLEGKDKDKEDLKNKSNNKVMNASLINSMIEKAKVEIKNEFVNKQKAYNSVKDKVGDFDYTDMNEKDIYKYALQNSGIDLQGNEDINALKLAFNVINKVSKIDNSFSYSNAKEEIDINI